MTTKKFWCHYIGRDGNTSKRRNIELTDIHELLPNVSNEGVKTPLWYEREADKYGQVYYNLYAQLNDDVAVRIIGGQLLQHTAEQISKSDETIENENKMRMEKYFSNYPKLSDERKAEEREFCDRQITDQKHYRDKVIAKIVKLQDYNNFLLSGSSWVSVATLRAYEEVQSPILSGLIEIRAIKMEERVAEDKRRQEEARKRREEEARKKAEEDRKEQERLDREAEKFKNGEHISGTDVVDLCRRYGITIHLRTVHNLQQVIADINGKEPTCSYYRARGQRRPQLDGCYKTARELYNYLQNN